MIRRLLRTAGYVSRLELDLAQQWATHLQHEREYWRTRAERLLDAALVRQGAIHEPTMADRPRPQPNRLHDFMRALAVTEIDSSTRKDAPTA